MPATRSTTRAHADWSGAISACFDILVDAFRSEPGFRGLRVGDVIDLRPAPSESTYKSIVADRLLDRMIERFGVEDGPDLRFRFETAIEVSDALAARAFARDVRGDDRFLAGRSRSSSARSSRSM